MDNVDAFIEACRNNDVVKVMACVSSVSTFGLDSNTASEYGGVKWSALVVAAGNNSEDVVA